jgi:hypothetical protein
LFAGSFLAEMTVQGTTLRDPLGSLTARAFVAKLSADGVLRQIDALALAPPVAFSANAAGAAVLVSKQPLPDDENGAEEYVVALLDESRAATEFSLTWPERAGTLNDVAIDDQRNVYICVSGWDSSAETAFGVLKQGEVALARFTPNGETVWLRQFSSLSYSTTFARRGSVLGMVGTFNAPLDLGSGLLTPNGEYSAFFAEFDLDGQSLYSTAFTNTEQTGFGKLHALADGWGAEFYTAGSGLTLGSPATAIPAGNYTMLIREVK